MIFDENYDRSLWYILKADRKDRKELVDFIKELPEEFLSMIRSAIEEEKKGEVKDISNRYISKNNPNAYYDFDLDYGLTITTGIFDGEMEEDKFEILLFPTTLEEIDEMGYTNKLIVGTITDITNLDDEEIEEIEREYALYHFPIGYYVSHAHEIIKGKSELVLFRRVNNKRIPKDITKENISKRLLTKHN